MALLRLLSFLLVLILSVCAKSDNGTYFNVIEKLHADLLTGYNKQVRPVLRNSDTLKVETAMRLTHLDYDEMQARFSARGYLLMTWKDPRLSWSPANYDGIKDINLVDHLVWTPDIETYNLDGELSKERTFAVSTSVLVMSDGTVVYVPLTNFVSKCYPRMGLWPFDRHICKVKFGSWAYNADKMTVYPQDNATTINMEDYLDDEVTPSWELISSSIETEIKKYACCPEPYMSQIFTFTIGRQAAMTKYTVLAPAFVIVALTLATFFIPPMVSAKMIVGMLDLLLLGAYLIHFNTVLPLTGTCPLIVTFYGVTMILVAISVVSTIATFSWTRLPKSRPPPACVTKLFTFSSLDRILAVDLLQKGDEQKLAEKKDFLSDAESCNAQQQWINLSLALHRLMFVIYCVIFACLFVTYIP